MSKQVTKTNQSNKSKGGKEKEKEKKKEEPKVESFEEMNGTGTFIYPNGNLYIGEYKQFETGEKHREGKGKYIIGPSETNPNGIESYDGEWKEDKMDGQGIYRYSNGEIYEGSWKNNMQHGKGVYKFANGCCYVGEWENHRMQGNGRYLYLNEKGFDGVFINGEFHTSAQPELLDQERITKKTEEIKGYANDFYKFWEDIFTKADKKTIKDLLSPFFATAETMGNYVKENYPKFEDKGADKWNEAFKFVFGLSGKGGKAGEEIKPTIQFNVPKTPDDLLFMTKEGLLAPQIQEELSSGQVIEMLTTLENRKVSLGIAYSKENEKWQVVFFNDVTEKPAKK